MQRQELPFGRAVQGFEFFGVDAVIQWSHRFP